MPTIGGQSSYMKKEVKTSTRTTSRPQSAAGKHKTTKNTQSSLPQGILKKKRTHHTSASRPQAAPRAPVKRDYASFRAESRARLIDCDKMHEELNEKLHKHGERSEHFMEALSHYAQHSCTQGQHLINEGDLDGAKVVLREAESIIKAHHTVASAYTLYQINNNLAALTNRMGHFKVSLKYMAAALCAGNDPRLVGRMACNLGETVLNMANTNSFLGNYPRALAQVEQAYGFAGKTAAQLEQQYNVAKAENASEAEIKELEDKFLEQIAISINSRHTRGQILEKTRNYERAVREYRAGVKLVEIHFGTQHHLWGLMTNAMSAAHLKNKTQGQQTVIKEHQRRKQGGSRRNIQTSLNLEQEAVQSRSTLSKRSSSTEKNVRKRIKNEVRYAKINREDGEGIFLANCETWERCHKRGLPGQKKRNSSAELREIRLSANKSLTLSAKKMRLKEKMASRKPLIRSKQEWPRRPFAPVHRDLGMANYPPPPETSKEYMISTTPRARSHSPSFISERSFRKARSAHKGHHPRHRSSMDHSTAASLIHNSPMRLLCKNGPGCKNHDWYKSLGHQDHTKYSHHGSSLSQPVGGGFQIAYRKGSSAKKERSKSPCCDGCGTGGGCSSGSGCLNCGKTPKKKGPLNYQKYCDMAQSERLYQQQMCNLRNVQEEQFKMLTIMLEQEAQTNSCCPVPPMTCMPIPGDPPEIEVLSDGEEEEAPHVRPRDPPRPPMEQQPPKPITKPRDQAAKDTSEEGSEGSCLEMKRKEIDYELELMRRECCFKAVEINKIIDVDHDHDAFEDQLTQQLLHLENHPDLKHFKCPVDKVCDPIQVTARIRSRSAYSGGYVSQGDGICHDQDCDDLSSYNSCETHEIRLHVVDKYDHNRLEAFGHLENVLKCFDKREMHQAFSHIYRIKNIAVDKPIVEERKHWFILDYQHEQECGEYSVIEFILVQHSLEFHVEIFEVVGLDGNKFKICVKAAHQKDHSDYIHLHCPLMVDLRYLAYFIKATLNIDYHREQGTLTASIDMMKWDGVEEFKLQMFEKERLWNLRPLAHETFNKKVINDQHQTVLDKDGKECKVKTGLSTSAKKDHRRSSRFGNDSNLSGQMKRENRSQNFSRDGSGNDRQSSIKNGRNSAQRSASRGREGSKHVSFTDKHSEKRQLSPTMHMTINSNDRVAVSHRPGSAQAVNSRKMNFPQPAAMVRDLKGHSESAQQVEQRSPFSKSQRSMGASDVATVYDESCMLEEFFITRTLPGGQNLEYLIKVFEKGNNVIVIQCINKDDYSDWKQIEPNMRTQLLNPANLASDINNQLMVYRVKSTGRINYLALVENSKYNSQTSPTRAHRPVKVHHSLNIKANQTGLFSNSGAKHSEDHQQVKHSDHYAHDHAHNQSGHLLLEAAALNKIGRSDSALGNLDGNHEEIKTYIDEHTSQGVIQFHQAYDVDQCHDGKMRTSSRRELYDNKKLSFRDSENYRSPSKDSGQRSRSPSKLDSILKNSFKNPVSETRAHMSPMRVSSLKKSTRTSGHKIIAESKTNMSPVHKEVGAGSSMQHQSSAASFQRRDSFGKHLLHEGDVVDVAYRKPDKKPTRLKTVRNLVQFNKLFVKYIVKEVSRGSWFITIKNMNTQQFICQDVPLPKGVFDNYDRNTLNESVSAHIERHVKQHEETYTQGGVPRKSGVLNI